MASGRAGRGSAREQRERRVHIAELVVKHGTLTIDYLVDATGVSLMTVYRDIAALEETGVLQRQRGHVSALASGLHEAGAAFRLTQGVDSKQAMAAVVAPRIPPGSSVLLDDSTSAVFVIRALENVVPLTVITNSILVSREVQRRSGCRLILTGGEYQPWAESLIGSWTLDSLQRIHADFCVMSASGIADGSCFHPYEDVAKVKRAMVDASAYRILLLDHTKFARRALHSFAALRDFDLVVVDNATDEQVVSQLASTGVPVEKAPPLQPEEVDEGAG